MYTESEYEAYNKFFQLIEQYKNETNEIPFIEKVNKNTKIISLDEFLDLVKARPRLYLGLSNQIGCFWAMINGFIEGKKEIVPEMYQKEKNEMFVQFQSYIESSFSKVNVKDKPWYKYIMFHIYPEERRLEQFFILFKKFKNHD